MFITAAKKTNLGDKIRIAFSSWPGLESQNEAAKVANNLKVVAADRVWLKDADGAVDDLPVPGVAAGNLFFVAAPKTKHIRFFSYWSQLPFHWL